MRAHHVNEAAVSSQSGIGKRFRYGLLAFIATGTLLIVASLPALAAGQSEMSLAAPGSGQFQILDKSWQPLELRAVPDYRGYGSEHALGVKYGALFSPALGYSLTFVDSTSKSGASGFHAGKPDIASTLSATGELNWSSDAFYYRVGFWVDSAKKEVFTDSVGIDKLGFYSDTDWVFGKGVVKTRIGLTQAPNLGDEGFFAVAAEYPWEKIAVGGGVLQTVTLAGRTDASIDESVRIDVYARFSLTKKINLIPSIQLKEEYELNSAGIGQDTSEFKGNLKLNYKF